MPRRLSLPALVSLTRELSRMPAGESGHVEKAVKARELTHSILNAKKLTAADLAPSTRKAFEFLERYQGLGRHGRVVSMPNQPGFVEEKLEVLRVPKSGTASRRVTALYENWKELGRKNQGQYKDSVSMETLFVRTVKARDGILALLSGRQAIHVLTRPAFQSYCTLEFLSVREWFDRWAEKKRLTEAWCASRLLNPDGFEIIYGPWLYAAKSAVQKSSRKKVAVNKSLLDVFFGKPGREEGWLIHPYLLGLPDPIWAHVLASLRGEMIPRRDRHLLAGLSRRPEVVSARKNLESRVDFRRRSVWKTEGRFHDLGGLFQRVNERYFQNTLTPAWLGWTSRPSLRRLGFYDPSGDRIVISKSLDHPAVPDYVVAYILYHEALHKFLGVECGGGRRRIHDRRFLDLEKRFDKARESERFLKTEWIRMAG